MSKYVIALIDGSAFSRPVLELAAWAARRNQWPVKLLHILPKRETASQDLSGAIKLGARSQLLEELSTLDAEHARLAAASGRALLDDARDVLAEFEITDVVPMLRQGDLLETVAGLEDDGSVVVIGKRGTSAGVARGHLGSNFERIVRSARLPVLMAPTEIGEISRIAVAFDGSASSRRAIERVIALPAYRNHELRILSGGAHASAHLSEARAVLDAAQRDASYITLDGQIDEALLDDITQSQTNFLVMGAYGHSRLRSLMVGSTTTAILQKSQVPVLLVR